jgi:hypothetical protein
VRNSSWERTLPSLIDKRVVVLPCYATLGIEPYDLTAWRYGSSSAISVLVRLSRKYASGFLRARTFVSVSPQDDEDLGGRQNEHTFQGLKILQRLLAFRSCKVRDDAGRCDHAHGGPRRRAGSLGQDLR